MDKNQIINPGDELCIFEREAVNCPLSECSTTQIRKSIEVTFLTLSFQSPPLSHYLTLFVLFQLLSSNKKKLQIVFSTAVGYNNNNTK